ncbi:2-dehydropantoate 2-reductase [Aliiglaciecola litoralis]|uniref:2-dehydropantoate 2-reductase n=1 Tax=Aliiglaciecola litoralis TaxID=582857 RepID=A0ABP3WW95_9ALTE
MITIVGNGAIGNLLALQCHKLGFEYQIMTRGAPLEKITVEGKICADICKLNIVKPHSKIESGLLILPLKAYQIVPCIEQLKDQISKNVSVIMLHNGMGTHLQAKALIPNHNIAVATTSYGAFKPETHRLNVTGLGQTQAGWLVKHSVNTLHQSWFSQLLPPCTWYNDIEPMLWHKLAINAIINPLTTLYDIPNGELTKSKYLPQIKQLASEIASVMGALKIDADAQQLVNNCLSVAKVTAKNYSSMHQDIHHERPTEIDFINGYIVQLAKSVGVAVHLNQQLLQKIKKMEN